MNIRLKTNDSKAARIIRSSFAFFHKFIIYYNSILGEIEFYLNAINCVSEFAI